MFPVKAYAARSAQESLQPYSLNRRALGPHDVLIDILYCGVCHSDIHQARDEWGGSIFPMVPGHEIIGKVSKLGSAVTSYQLGESVGVGCFVDSCRECQPCLAGIEQYCTKGMILTYNGREKDGTPTYGGYSTQIVVDENYLLKIPTSLPLDQVAPLLCAGITTYSPLRHWKIKAGDQVAVVGLGGLGHMAVKFAAAMGAEVTVFSTSSKKAQDAYRMGAKNFANTSAENTFAQYAQHFDFMLNTVSAAIDINQYLNLLKLDGTLVVVGVPAQPFALNAIPIVMQRRCVAGSLIGGIKETQEMLDFCGQHNITADIEVIAMDKINAAYERMMKGDVRYRFVIDMGTLK